METAKCEIHRSVVTVCHPYLLQKCSVRLGHHQGNSLIFLNLLLLFNRKKLICHLIGIPLNTILNVIGISILDGEFSELVTSLLIEEI